MTQSWWDWKTRFFSKPPPSTIGNNCPSRISFFCSQFGRPSECRPFVRLSPSHYHSNRGEQSPVESTCSTPLNPITFRKIVHSKVVSFYVYEGNGHRNSTRLQIYTLYQIRVRCAPFPPPFLPFIASKSVVARPQHLCSLDPVSISIVWAINNMV